MELTPEQKASIDEQKQYCPFCKIVKGEIPAVKVFEDSDVIGILDINPATTGHILLVPKEHYPVFPFVPEKLQEKLGTLLPLLGGAATRATVSSGAQWVLANGAAAGQQTSHFLIHLFPTTRPIVSMPTKPSEEATALRTALTTKYGDPRDRLAALLTKNPELREYLVERPKAFMSELANAPDLAKLFAGVDIAALGQELAETTPPRAARAEDEALTAFLLRKEKLRSLLLGDLETLEAAVASQPKLQRFFEGTTVAAVATRVKALMGGTGNV